ncbi:hypothetical protein NKH77_39870 [Streptomyces sp. M19]
MSDLPTIRTLTDLRIHYADSARIPAALMPTVREIVRERYDQGAPYALSPPKPDAPTAGRTAQSWPPAPRSVAGAAEDPPRITPPRKGPHGRAVPSPQRPPPPWTNDYGHPCYLQPGSEGGHMWQRADLVETTLLADGAEVLAHSRTTLASHHVAESELRGMARCLVESLASALLVAESRGRRL